MILQCEKIKKGYKQFFVYKDMRVLLCERSFGGHRRTYLEWLSKIQNIDIYVYAPENVGVEESHFISCDSELAAKNVRVYHQWITNIRRIVNENHIDVVHLLDGDSIMRYFGIGFSRFGCKKIVITYHHFFTGFARKISYQMMCYRKDRSCVAHTESVYQSLRKCWITNIDVCEYPAFGFERISSRNPEECKRRFGLSDIIPTIGIIGGINRYKNIIPFLFILKNCKVDFQLLICGKVGDITENDIIRAVNPYKEKVKLILRTLTEDEYEDAIVASDIIYCLYGHEFDGASGPLADGVCAKKMILSSKHGSLGKITTQNCLGVVAECDDSEEVLTQTEFALKGAIGFQYSDTALQFRDSLNPIQFVETYRKIYGE